jgi:hypothetical protein
LSKNLREALFYTTIVLAMIAGPFWAGIAHGKGGPREGNDPAISKWFSEQHNSAGGWCCNEADGHRYYGDYVVHSDGTVTIAPGTPDEYHIEAWKVLTGPNPTGGAVWWFNEGPSGKNTYCFAPGSLT